MSMTTTALQEWWREAANHRRLTLEIPYTVNLQARTVTFPVLLRGFGPHSGMLLVTDLEAINTFEEELIAQGFGYSCLLQLETPFSAERDLKHLDELLLDWSRTK